MLHVKSDDDLCDDYEMFKDNGILNEPQHSSQMQHLDANYVGMLGVFSKVILRIIEDDKDHVNADQLQGEGKVSIE